MAVITKILGSEKRSKDDKEYLLVWAIVEDKLGNQQECKIYVGGEVELFFSSGQVKAHVRRAQSRGKIPEILLDT